MACDCIVWHYCIVDWWYITYGSFMAISGWIILSLINHVEGLLEKKNKVNTDQKGASLFPISSPPAQEVQGL